VQVFSVVEFRAGCATRASPRTSTTSDTRASPWNGLLTEVDCDSFLAVSPCRRATRRRACSSLSMRRATAGWTGKERYHGRLQSPATNRRCESGRPDVQVAVPASAARLIHEHTTGSRKRAYGLHPPPVRKYKMTKIGNGMPMIHKKAQPSLFTVHLALGPPGGPSLVVKETRCQSFTRLPPLLPR